jgi:hypothetical protein
MVILHFAVVSAEAPVQVLSVVGPIPPYNPGGPVVNITLWNVATLSIVSLNAILRVPSAEPSVAYSFSFAVSSSNSLLPGQITQSTLILIGAGFDSSRTHPLTISGVLGDGSQFSFTNQVWMEQPS